VDRAGDFGDLFSIYEWVMVTVAVLVAGAVAVALVRSRRAGAPAKRASHHLVEGLYAVALAVAAALLVAATFRTESRTDSLSGDPAFELEAVAFQWGWVFGHAGRSAGAYGTDERPPVLVVPQGRTIRVTLRSNDVIHALWIPSLRFKRDAFPDRTTRFDVTFEKAGRFVGRCAEFCGLEHEGMVFYLDVVSPAEFTRWLSRHGPTRE
jgi:cytochrome c oxidase subunit 2